MAIEERAREDRATEERRERRRRDDATLDNMQNLKLAVPDHIRTTYPNDEFRWINDAGNRMYNLTVLDDWTKVDEVDAIPVDTTKDGKPINAHLCHKPSDWWRQDQAKKLKAADDLEAKNAPGLDPNAKPDRCSAS